MKCKLCKSDSFYDLKNSYIKCKKCHKKYSLRKLNQEKRINRAFCDNKNANEASKYLNLNYRTVKDRYDYLRFYIAKFLEDEYNKSVKDYSNYEEYYYFNTKQKTKKVKSLYSAINIMGFYSNKKVYTLLMPKIPKRALSEDDGFKEYLNWYKIHSLNSYKTDLKRFWLFLEQQLKKYKGINEENFFLYLKECEFRFNYEYEKQFEILELC